MALFTQILKPRVVSPFGGALDTTPTSGVGVSGFADPNAAPVRAAPSSQALDVNPGGQLPTSGTLSGGLSAPVQIFQPLLVNPTGPPPTVTTPVGGGGGGSSGPLLGAAPGTPIDTTGGAVGSFDPNGPTARLLDLIAAQYAAGAQGGTSPDFGGLLTAPVGPGTGAPDTTGDGTTTTTATAPSQAHPLVLLLILAVIVGGVYYWRKHRKAKAA